jgi:hypothetical protein
MVIATDGTGAPTNKMGYLVLETIVMEIFANNRWNFSNRIQM